MNDMMRDDIRAGNIDAYGDYTVEHWFSAGADADPFAETYADQGAGRSLTIMSFGLAGETGEVLEKIKKIFRDGTLEPEALKKELGDVGFYWARLCRYFGWDPSEVIGTNVDKLDSRRSRGMMRGSGDNR